MRAKEAIPRLHLMFCANTSCEASLQWLTSRRWNGDWARQTEREKATRLAGDWHREMGGEGHPRAKSEHFGMIMTNRK